MKHDRFRMLEGERPATPEPAPLVPKVSDRFAAVDAPKPASELELDPRDTRDRRAHVRCIECAHENGAFAEACAKCHATLLTRAVHRLNVRLHQDEELARRKAEPVAATVQQEIVEAEPVVQKTLLDRIAGEITFGSLRLRRAIVVGVIGAVFGLFYLATGWGVLGFAFGLIVTLGLCLVAT